MRAAGRVAALTLQHVGARLKPGITTAQIDRWVRAHTAEQKARPSQLGYQGFPAAVCTSRNEVVCHGIPREDVQLENGDIINVDVTSELDGWHGDCSATFCIGEVSSEARHLVETTRRALELGIETVRPGIRLGEIGAAIEAFARREGCTVVSTWGGHGIGRAMHLPPHVSHVGPAKSGPELVEGMCFTIEPMLCLGSPETRTLKDGWTVVTVDGRWSAQFEHTVLVTRRGVERLTVLQE